MSKPRRRPKTRSGDPAATSRTSRPSSSGRKRAPGPEAKKPARRTKPKKPAGAPRAEEKPAIAPRTGKQRALASKGQTKRSHGTTTGAVAAVKRPRKRQQPEPELPASSPALEDDEFSARETGIGSRVTSPDLELAEELAEEEVERSPDEKSSERDVEAQLRALEARLDGLIRRTGTAGAETETDVTRVEAVDPGVPETSQPSESVSPADADASELGQNPFYIKQWGRGGLRSRAEEVDDFGRDPSYEVRLQPITNFLYKRYFRVKAEGITNIPNEGRCVIVANHSGTLPLDGAMLKTALRLEHPASRDLRWLAEDFIYYLPFVGVLFNRVGAVRACQENAERLLRKESLVAVFPEGIKGIKKLYKDRYRLERFGRGGFVRLCLRTRTPLVPCAVIGGEETNPMLYRIEYISKLFGLPYIPVTPTFPLLGPLGLLPAPSRWRIMFGELMSFDEYGPEAADDHVLVGRLSERVQNAIQELLDDGLRRRKSVWLG